ncbi:hypothetical protein RvY_08987-2 [Ramazzottius varieornatus]|uniref:SUZ domain-containing protein n=1 Tax=Ramazzottius varieornatus TaxID=947166 RepID=A0A1D1V7U4_RAMVA|nr:hypothetical protein RvY_08987-2 [Ramazzottius varieornatus]
MQKSGKKNEKEEDYVRDSWEELEEDLDHMVVLPEPKEVKHNESSRKKENPKSAVEQDGSQLPADQSMSLDSSAPEPGKVRILKRDPAPAIPNSATLPTKVSTPITKTYEERIKHYNEARLRILGSIDDEVQR